MSDNNETPSITIEKISDPDKAVLDAAKMKRENALLQSKLALANQENADLHYNNAILRLALSYGLKDGDIIEENGVIQRKSEVV